MSKISVFFILIFWLGCGAGENGTKPTDGGLPEKKDGAIADGDLSLPERELIPGVGVDDFILIGTHSYSDVKEKISQGDEVSNRSSSRFFPSENMEINFADTLMDAQLSEADRVLMIKAAAGYRGATPEGIMVGDALSEIENFENYKEPDFSGEIVPSTAFDEGEYIFFFTKGIFFKFVDETIGAIGVHPAYQRAPDGNIKPETGSLLFGDESIVAGDGMSTGDPQEKHRTILGEPDYSGVVERTFEVEKPPFGTIEVEITLTLDIYRILGLQFSTLKKIKTPLQTENKDHLVATVVFSPYYGKTTQGFGIGSTREEIENGLDISQTQSYEGEEGKLYVYDITGGYRFGVGYEHGGEPPSSRALLFVLNFPEDIQ